MRLRLYFTTEPSTPMTWTHTACSILAYQHSIHSYRHLSNMQYNFISWLLNAGSGDTLGFDLDFNLKSWALCTCIDGSITTMVTRVHRGNVVVAILTTSVLKHSYSAFKDLHLNHAPSLLPK